VRLSLVGSTNSNQHYQTIKMHKTKNSVISQEALQLNTGTTYVQVSRSQKIKVAE